MAKQNNEHREDGSVVESSAGETAGGDQVGGDKIGTQINTAGGAVFQGPVSAAGNVIGGDQIINFYQVDQPQVEKPFNPKIEPQTVQIPAGTFLLGSEPGDGVPEYETPQIEVALAEFFIGRFPITNRLYERYIRANKEVDPPGSWFNRQPPEELLDHPVVEVSWYEAMAYCAWLGQETGRDYRLPSEAEWEKTASWAPDGKRRYPWGAAWEAGRCNAGGEGTTEVTAFKSGASAYGAVDMLGNVEEWTRSAWGSHPNEAQFTYEDYDADDGRDVEGVEELGAQMRVIYRGGSYRSKPEDMSVTRRRNSAPSSKIAWRGFRVVLLVK